MLAVDIERAEREFLSHYVMSRCGGDFRKGGVHPLTFSRILNRTELPFHQEIVDLILFSEVVSSGDREMHSQIFGIDHLMYHPCDLHGVASYGFAKHSVFHILTREFVRAVAAEIPLGYTAVEVAAGNGKLSHWLSHFAHKVTPTDKVPGSSYVMSADCEAALRLEPDIVIGSWLPPTDDKTTPLNLQRMILETRCVEKYIEITAAHENSGIDVSGHGLSGWSRRVLSEAQRFSLPVDLFVRDYRHGADSKFSTVLPRFKDYNAEYCMEQPSVFVWERTDEEAVTLYRAINSYELKSVLSNAGVGSASELEEGEKYRMHFQLEGRWADSVEACPADLRGYRVLVSYTTADESRMVLPPGVCQVINSIDDDVTIVDIPERVRG